VRIIPVIDLKAGVVVRGVGGRREEYRPVESVLTEDPSPKSVARAFVERLGLRELYVADLDAIAGAAPAWNVYRELLALGSDLWVDAGVDSMDRAEALVEFCCQHRPLARIVVGLESLPQPELLSQLVQRVGANRLVFSLDLKAGRPLTTIDRWQGAAPEDIAAEAVDCGVRAMIVLDLAYVGESHGVGVAPLCAQIRAQHKAIELISGGGVREGADLELLERSGCDAALVASALHDGRLVGQVSNLSRAQGRLWIED
jgi:phosphoribosylformimino-5-aminoimidazole carboxamide ribotide isomerase